MNNIIIYVWGINESKKFMIEQCKLMIDTANHYNITWKFLGIGTKFINHTQRIQLLSKQLSKLPNSTIVLCMDGADTLFNNDMSGLINTFLKQKTKILISAEKHFSHQYED
jgi:hypothetical protein